MTGGSTNGIQQITDMTVNADCSFSRSQILIAKEKGFSSWKLECFVFCVMWSRGKGHGGWMRTRSNRDIIVFEQLKKKRVDLTRQRLNVSLIEQLLLTHGWLLLMLGHEKRCQMLAASLS